MERKTFLKTCGLACVTGAFLTPLLQGCSNLKMVSGTISDSDLLVPLSSFQMEGEKFRNHIVVSNDSLKYPICVYRFGEDQYTALLMRCTHQGTELQVFGDRLQCPAHGSEFSNKGIVQNGPADTNLRTFPVTRHNTQLYISLK
jgi:nitrite reductase/ring-hydroxylating ferredoxin subunit